MERKSFQIVSCGIIILFAYIVSLYRYTVATRLNLQHLFEGRHPLLAAPPTAFV